MVSQVSSVSQYTGSGGVQSAGQVSIKGLEGSFLTIYQNVSTLTDSFKIQVVDPETKLTYQPIVQQMFSDSAFVHLKKGDGHLLSQSLETQSFSFLELYRSLIGKEILVEAALPAGSATIEGTLMEVLGNQLLFLTPEKNGLVKISIDQILSLNAPGLDQLTFNQPHLNILYASESPHEVEGQILYLTGGFQWNPLYRLLLEEKDSKELKGTLLSQAQIVNQTNQTLRDVIIRVVSGHLNFSQTQSIRNHPFNAVRAEAAYCSDAGSIAAVDQAWEDYKAYLIPSKINLKPSERVLTPLFEPKKVLVEKGYLCHFHEYEQSEKHPKISYHIENTQENHLGQAFPGGKVQVFNQEESGPSFIGEHVLVETPDGKDLDILIGEAFDLGVKRSTTIHSIKNSQGKVMAQKITVTIDCTNAKDQEVTLRLHEHFSGKRKLLKASFELPFENEEAVFSVKIPAKTTSKNPLTLTYTYEKELI